MSRDDNSLASVLWLVAGSAAGYAAGRFVVAPLLEKQAPPTRSMLTTVAAPAPRALSSGPQPLDPYGAPMSNPYVGPSGDMYPIDPYGDVAPSSVPAAPVVSAPPTISVVAPTSHPVELSPVASPTTSSPVTTPNAPPTVTPPTTGPITSPSQLVEPDSALVKPVASSSGFATKSRVRRFDAVFARYRGDLPIEYVRALVERESDGEPAVRARSASGLMQIVPIVLSDYNKRHGTAYRSEHLTDPAVNVAIGCELLRLIVASYRKNHPRIPALQADWNNPRFVELLTFGWNAGYSEAGGLGRVARYLEQLGARDIDVDLVAAHAKLARATKHLSNPAKLAWSKSVAALYQRERALARTVFASS